MSKKFVLTAELQFRKSSDVNKFVEDIKKKFSDIDLKVRTTGTQQAVSEMKKLKTAVDQTNDSVDQIAKTFALSFKRFISFSVATRAVSLFTSRLNSAFRQAREFEVEMIKVSQVTGKTVKQLSDLTNEIGRLSTNFGVSSNTLARTSVLLSQAGFSARDTRVALDALAKSELAPTFSNIIETTEGAIAIFNQFGRGADALSAQLGAINKIAGTFAVEAGDLIEVVRRVGGVFKSSGGDMNELLALFTSVRQTTRENAESIATALRTIFVRIQRPKTIEYLRKYGIELTDEMGRFIGPFEAIEKIYEKFGNMEPGDLRLIEAGEVVAGFRQIGKFIPLIQQYRISQEALNVAKEGENSLDEDALKAKEGLANQLARLNQEFQQLIRGISDSPTFKLVTKFFIDTTSAVIKLVDSLKPLIPLFTAFAGIKLARIAGGFGKGFTSELGKARAFNSGGGVPGFGNTDTVPAMLTPGEFVINKRSARELGAARLHRLNKLGPKALNEPQYLNTGGFVNFSPQLTRRGQAPGNVGRDKQLLTQQIDFLKAKEIQDGGLEESERELLKSLTAKNKYIQKSRNKRFSDALFQGTLPSVQFKNKGGNIYEVEQKLGGLTKQVKSVISNESDVEQNDILKLSIIDKPVELTNEQRDQIKNNMGSIINDDPNYKIPKIGDWPVRQMIISSIKNTEEKFAERYLQDQKLLNPQTGQRVKKLKEIYNGLEVKNYSGLQKMAPRLGSIERQLGLEFEEVLAEEYKDTIGKKTEAAGYPVDFINKEGAVSEAKFTSQKVSDAHLISKALRHKLLSSKNEISEQFKEGVEDKQDIINLGELTHYYTPKGEKKKYYDYAQKLNTGGFVVQDQAIGLITADSYNKTNKADPTGGIYRFPSGWEKDGISVGSFGASVYSITSLDNARDRILEEAKLQREKSLNNLLSLINVSSKKTNYDENSLKVNAGYITEDLIQSLTGMTRIGNSATFDFDLGPDGASEDIKKRFEDNMNRPLSEFTKLLDAKLTASTDSFSDLKGKTVDFIKNKGWDPGKSLEENALVLDKLAKYGISYKSDISELMSNSGIKNIGEQRYDNVEIATKLLNKELVSTNNNKWSIPDTSIQNVSKREFDEFVKIALGFQAVKSNYNKSLDSLKTKVGENNFEKDVSSFKEVLKNNGISLLEFAGGGPVPGTGNRDTVPAMLTPGEYVLNKRAAESLGINTLNKLNTGKKGGKSRDGVSYYGIKDNIPGGGFGIIAGIGIFSSMLETLAKEGSNTSFVLKGFKDSLTQAAIGFTLYETMADKIIDFTSKVDKETGKIEGSIFSELISKLNPFAKKDNNKDADTKINKSIDSLQDLIYKFEGEPKYDREINKTKETAKETTEETNSFNIDLNNFTEKFGSSIDKFKEIIEKFFDFESVSSPPEKKVIGFTAANKEDDDTYKLANDDELKLAKDTSSDPRELQKKKSAQILLRDADKDDELKLAKDTSPDPIELQKKKSAQILLRDADKLDVNSSQDVKEKLTSLKRVKEKIEKEDDPKDEDLKKARENDLDQINEYIKALELLQNKHNELIKLTKNQAKAEEELEKIRAEIVSNEKESENFDIVASNYVNNKVTDKHDDIMDGLDINSNQGKIDLFKSLKQKDTDKRNDLQQSLNSGDETVIDKTKEEIDELNKIIEELSSEIQTLEKIEEKRVDLIKREAAATENFNNTSSKQKKLESEIKGIDFSKLDTDEIKEKSKLFDMSTKQGRAKVAGAIGSLGSAISSAVDTFAAYLNAKAQKALETGNFSEARSAMMASNDAQAASSAISGISSGMAMGAAFGPIGIAAGGVAGGLSSLYTTIMDNKSKMDAINYKILEESVNSLNLSIQNFENKLVSFADVLDPERAKERDKALAEIIGRALREKDRKEMSGPMAFFDRFNEWLGDKNLNSESKALNESYTSSGNRDQLTNLILDERTTASERNKYSQMQSDYRKQNLSSFSSIINSKDLSADQKREVINSINFQDFKKDIRRTVATTAYDKQDLEKQLNAAKAAGNDALEKEIKLKLAVVEAQYRSALATEAEIKSIERRAKSIQEFLKIESNRFKISQSVNEAMYLFNRQLERGEKGINVFQESLDELEFNRKNLGGRSSELKESNDKVIEELTKKFGFGENSDFVKFLQSQSEAQVNIFKGLEEFKSGKLKVDQNDITQKGFKEAVLSSLGIEGLGADILDEFLTAIEADLGIEGMQDQDRVAQALLDPKYQEILNKSIEQYSGSFNDLAKGLADYNTKISDLYKKRTAAESEYISQIASAFDLKKQAKKTIEEFDGEIFTVEKEKQIINERYKKEQKAIDDMEGVAKGIVGVDGKYLQKRFKERAARAEKRDITDPNYNSPEQVAQRDRDRLANQSDIQITQDLIANKKKEIELIKAKNKLEQDAISALARGNIEEFFDKIDAQAAIEALAAGDTTILKQLGPRAIAAGVEQLQSMQSSGITSFNGQNVSSLIRQGQQETLGATLGYNSAMALRNAQMNAELDQINQEGMELGRALDDASIYQEQDSLANFNQSAYIFSSSVEMFQKIIKQLEASISFPAPQASDTADNNEAQNKSSGGLIYANKGKFIDFKPRGTDTVPAMLTPGEFVVNKKSAKNNLPLLKAINSSEKPTYASFGGLISIDGEGFNTPPEGITSKNLSSFFKQNKIKDKKWKQVIKEFIKLHDLSESFGIKDAVDRLELGKEIRQHLQMKNSSYLSKKLGLGSFSTRDGLKTISMGTVDYLKKESPVSMKEIMRHEFGHAIHNALGFDNKKINGIVLKYLQDNPKVAANIKSRLSPKAGTKIKIAEGFAHYFQKLKHRDVKNLLKTTVSENPIQNIITTATQTGIQPTKAPIKKARSPLLRKPIGFGQAPNIGFGQAPNIGFGQAPNIGFGQASNIVKTGENSIPNTINRIFPNTITNSAQTSSLLSKRPNILNGRFVPIIKTGGVGLLSGQAASALGASEDVSSAISLASMVPAQAVFNRNPALSFRSNVGVAARGAVAFSTAIDAGLTGYEIYSDPNAYLEKNREKFGKDISQRGWGGLVLDSLSGGVGGLLRPVDTIIGTGLAAADTGNLRAESSKQTEAAERKMIRTSNESTGIDFESAIQIQQRRKTRDVSGIKNLDDILLKNYTELSPEERETYVKELDRYKEHLEKTEYTPGILEPGWNYLKSFWSGDSTNQNLDKISKGKTPRDIARKELELIEQRQQVLKEERVRLSQDPIAMPPNAKKPFNWSEWLLDVKNYLEEAQALEESAASSQTQSAGNVLEQVSNGSSFRPPNANRNINSSEKPAPANQNSQLAASSQTQSARNVLEQISNDSSFRPPNANRNINSSEKPAPANQKPQLAVSSQTQSAENLPSHVVAGQSELLRTAVPRLSREPQALTEEIKNKVASSQRQSAENLPQQDNQKAKQSPIDHKLREIKDDTGRYSVKGRILSLEDNDNVQIEMLKDGRKTTKSVPLSRLSEYDQQIATDPYFDRKLQTTENKKTQSPDTQKDNQKGKQSPIDYQFREIKDDTGRYSVKGRILSWEDNDNVQIEMLKDGRKTTKSVPLSRLSNYDQQIVTDPWFDRSLQTTENKKTQSPDTQKGNQKAKQSPSNHRGSQQPSVSSSSDKLPTTSVNQQLAGFEQNEKPKQSKIFKREILSSNATDAQVETRFENGSREIKTVPLKNLDRGITYKSRPMTINGLKTEGRIISADNLTGIAKIQIYEENGSVRTRNIHLNNLSDQDRKIAREISMDPYYEPGIDIIPREIKDDTGDHSVKGRILSSDDKFAEVEIHENNKRKIINVPLDRLSKNDKNIAGGIKTIRDSTGAFQVEGKIISSDNGFAEVEIHENNKRKIINVPLDRLSNEDKNIAKSLRPSTTSVNQGSEPSPTPKTGQRLAAEYQQKESAQNEKQSVPTSSDKQSPIQIKTIRDNTGAFQVEGKIISSDNGFAEVEIHENNKRKIINVPLRRLSDEDKNIAESLNLPTSDSNDQQIKSPDAQTKDNSQKEESTDLVKNKSGGLIYANKGKFIDFKPRGTDTVPAMLTPGEFVLRKSTVDKIGVPRLNKLNKTGYFNTGGSVSSNPSVKQAGSNNEVYTDLSAHFEKFGGAVEAFRESVSIFKDAVNLGSDIAKLGQEIANLRESFNNFTDSNFSVQLSPTSVNVNISDMTGSMRQNLPEEAQKEIIDRVVEELKRGRY